MLPTLTLSAFFLLECRGLSRHATRDNSSFKALQLAQWNLLNARREANAAQGCDPTVEEAQ